MTITLRTPRTVDPLSLVLHRYIRSLEAEGIPLTEPLTVAAVLADLAELAETPVPAAVLRALSGDDEAA